MSEYEQAIFISYAWGKQDEERERIVNELDQSLQKRGLTIIRDKRDLGYKGAIRQFMERIGQGYCVIVVISDKYLRSKNCMYEFVEIAGNKQYADRIFPIILEDANIYDWRGRVDYVKFWEKEKAELEESIRGMKDLSNLKGLTEELNDYDRFRDEIDNMTSTLKNMNSLTPEMLREADFEQLYEALLTHMPVFAASQVSVPDAQLQPKAKSNPDKERKSMDPITLATTATTLLAPYISKLGEKALDKIAEQLPEKIGGVWSAISNRFKDKPLAVATTSEFATNADDEDNQQAFALQLKKMLKEDDGFASLLTDLLEEAQHEAGISNVGDGVVATNGSIGNVFKTGGSISGSTINISSNVQSSDSQARSKK